MFSVLGMAYVCRNTRMRRVWMSYRTAKITCDFIYVYYSTQTQTSLSLSLTHSYIFHFIFLIVITYALDVKPNVSSEWFWTEAYYYAKRKYVRWNEDQRVETYVLFTRQIWWWMIFVECWKWNCEFWRKKKKSYKNFDGDPRSHRTVPIFSPSKYKKHKNDHNEYLPNELPANNFLYPNNKTKFI